MLLTYEEFAEIPRKKHVFYRQAFDTLFQKHDANKEQFQRKIKTGIQLEEFRSCFAAFCGFSYIKEVFSFDDESLSDFASKAAKYTKNSGDIAADVKSQEFIDDLFEAVCMLQKDGVHTAFVHRSFQEYFAALFATKLSPENMIKFLNQYSLRFSDSAVSMAFDMSKEVVETEWVGPTIQHLLAILTDEKMTPVERYSKFIPSVSFLRRDQGVGIGMFTHGEHLSTLEIVLKLYPEAKIHRLYNFGSDITGEEISKALLLKKNSKRKGYDNFVELLSGDPESLYHTCSNYSSDDQWWFDAVGGTAALDHLVVGLSKLGKAIQVRDKRASIIIESML